MSADYTLDDLWERGVKALQEEQPAPGKTYEVGPEIIGTMPYPTLRIRERVREIGTEAQTLFREDAEPKDFVLRELQNRLSFARAGDASEYLSEDQTIEDVEEQIESLKEEGAKDPVREGLKQKEWTMTTARVNCKEAVEILDFEQEASPQDINPEMAAVVTAHFTRLAPGTKNGQRAS